MTDQTASSANVETDVLVVGAGPAGASVALLLSTYGVRTMVLNKHAGPAPTPRAHITNQRTVEVLRDLGLEQDVVRVATPQHQLGEHVWATSLLGEELGRMRTWYTHPASQAEHDLASPCAVCDVPQTLLEPILLDAAVQRGSVLQTQTCYQRHRQDDDGVTTTVLDTVSGITYEIRSRYLVGADGGRSQVASDIGLPLSGVSGLGGSIGVYFRADLAAHVRHRPGSMYWMIQPGVGVGGQGVGALRMVRPWDRWVATSGFDQADGPPELDAELARSIVHKIIGDEIDVEVLSIGIWTLNSVHATEGGRGRVVCVGDAVHRHSPMYGLGSNTCIGDAYNLAWKLAMILRGHAGEGLLSTYQDERVPVWERVVDMATRGMGHARPLLDALGLDGPTDAAALDRRLAVRRSDTPDGARMRRDFRQAVRETLPPYNSLGIGMNHRYRSAAVVDDGAVEPDAGQDPDVHFLPSARPGAHLPHAWLVRDGRKLSTLDLCGNGAFTLLTGPVAAKRWAEAAALAESELCVPIPIRVIGPNGDADDLYGDYEALTGIGEEGALLVRPDMVVAWRASASAEADDLVAVLSRVLALTDDRTAVPSAKDGHGDQGEAP